MSENIRTIQGYNPQVKAIDQYILLFGRNDLIPTKWFTSEKYKSIDEVYKECVIKNVTWRELTGWDLDEQKKILL